MTSVLSVQIDNVGSVPAFAEVTSQPVLDAYNAEITDLVNVFEKTTPITAADHVIVANAMIALQDLAANGVFNPQSNAVEFITIEMANAINNISRSLGAVGFTGAETGTAATNVINQWRDLQDVGLREVFELAQGAIRYNRSLQSIIELEYVRTGNDRIFAVLSQLQTATGLTQEALNLLERAQSIKNQINATNRLDSEALFVSGGGAFTNDFDAIVSQWEAGDCAVNIATPGDNFCTVGEFTSAYTRTLDPIFDLPVTPVVDETPETPAIDVLSPETFAEFNQVIADLTQLVSELDIENPVPPGLARESTIQGRIEIVLNDMSQGLAPWINDNYASTQSPQSGNFQRNLTEAITTSQAINDQQRQDLRRQLFIFEEFYRSASAALTGINQIINRMASNVSR